MNSVYRTAGDWAHLAWGIYGALRYGRKYRKLRIVAVTGTDGKSSTVVLVARLLQKAGYRTAYYSSIEYSEGDTVIQNINKMTMPGRAGLHKFLARSAQQGVQFAVVEMTSEGVKQWRHFGIDLDGLVLTNIYPEHIARHKNFTNYQNTKLSLLNSVKKDGFVCLPDFLNKQTFVRVPVHVVAHNFLTLDIQTDSDPFLYENLQRAQKVIEALGLKVSELSAEEMVLPGRFEIIARNPLVIVDYAHTVPALNRCLDAVRKLSTGKVIHVFGAAGGGRDTSKRPELAKVSEQFADIHILTEENSFDEPIASILSDIREGFSARAKVYTEIKREDAVRLAVELASPGDTIICTAKGSETVIAIAGGIHRPYNERIFISQCLEST